MTEVKWAILFSALFVTLVFGLEYKIKLVKELTVGKEQYDFQLDTCLSDTLRNTEFLQEKEAFYFLDPEKVRRELETQLEFFLPREADWQQSLALLVLYEPDGFYCFSSGEERVSEKTFFKSSQWEGKLQELETAMEERLRSYLQEEGKTKRLSFAFPTGEKSFYGQTVEGTGLLLVYEGREAFFKGQGYQRFLLSGARVEGAA